MPFSTVTNTFEDVLDNFEGMTVWMSELGAAISATRIAAYRKALRELVTVQKNDDVNRLLTHQDSYLDMLFEVSELNFIYSGLQGKEVLGLDVHLQAMKDGPLRRTGEKAATGSIKPRNTAFELIVAANLSRIGVSVDLSQIEDVRARLDTHDYVIECKRPSAVSKIVARIDEALKRCEARIKSPLSKTVCVAAIDLSSVWNPEHRTLSAENVRMIDSLLGDGIDGLINTCVPQSKLHCHPRAVALLARIATLATARDTSMPFYEQQWRYVINSKTSNRYAGSSNRLKTAFSAAVQSG